MSKIINNFRGVYFWLSTFYPVKIKVAGLVFNSVEVAFQAMKCRTAEERKQFVGLKPKEAKELGRSIPIRSGWNDDRVRVMKELLKIKFQQPFLRGKLLQTGDAVITHENTWNDKFWGVVDGEGQDMLGLLLTQLRSELAKRRAEKWEDYVERSLEEYENTPTDEDDYEVSFDKLPNVEWDKVSPLYKK